MKAKILMLLVALLMGNLSVMSQDVIESNGSVTVGSHKDHYWVDLGLSVKWATSNVGAKDPYKAGSYYTRENGSEPAATIWGGNWRMPTIDEWVELVLNCDWKWIKTNEHIGALGTSKKNGQGGVFRPLRRDFTHQRFSSLDVICHPYHLVYKTDFVAKGLCFFFIVCEKKKDCALRKAQSFA